ncbi:MAG: VWA domain-containing protein [Armatimonadota bacterium]|nr:VWA domain-containing protein [Armatimonadota bacterium]MDW8025041.1 VWA domain-containing protein [Armatimonadota bacterium]
MDVTEIQMDVALGEGVRRLPVYLLLDCSGSMAGAPIEAVRRGVELFIQEVKNDPFARETVHVSIITFDSDARMVTNGLVPIDQLQLPQLSASGSTSLGKAVKLLQESLDRDIRPAIRGKEKGDWKPLVFILTDGKPTDDWQTPHQEIKNRQERKVLNVITVGCGPEIDEQTLKEIAIGPTFRMDNSEASFRTFFQWVSQSVRTVSKIVTQPGGGEQAESGKAVALPSDSSIRHPKSVSSLNSGERLLVCRIRQGSRHAIRTFRRSSIDDCFWRWQIWLIVVSLLATASWHYRQIHTLIGVPCMGNWDSIVLSEQALSENGICEKTVREMMPSPFVQPILGWLLLSPMVLGLVQIHATALLSPLKHFASISFVKHWGLQLQSSKQQKNHQLPSKRTSQFKKKHSPHRTKKFTDISVRTIC